MVSSILYPSKYSSIITAILSYISVL